MTGWDDEATTGRGSAPVRSGTGTERSDAELFEAAVAGRMSAFAALIDRYEQPLRRYAASLLTDMPAAEDVSQEVFLRLWKHRSRYCGSQHIRALLFTIARNHCRSVLRRQRVLSWVGLDSAAPEHLRSGTPSAFGALDAEQTTGMVRDGVQALPEHFRTPIVLRYVEGLSYEDIAKVIGRTPSTARSRVHYGLKQLGKVLPKEVAPWDE